MPVRGCTVLELRHRATGARHLHVACDDDNALFSVIFMTLPADSTGVAHILEHVVLCGSRRYPVRDPFFALSGSSLATFMNALTAPDWTMYPFSTRNRREFRNLLQIYLDAAFFPLLEEDAFRQEGIRVEFDRPDDPSSALRFRGVVFNEMKSGWPAPGRAMGEAMRRALFPGLTYENSSGGDPAQIPDLTHDQLLAFHARHYHPGNARFFTYGDLDLEPVLEIIESRVLSHFGAPGAQLSIPAVSRRLEPVRVTARFPPGAGEDAARSAQAAVAWVTGAVSDSRRAEAVGVLADILLANSASPLRHRLINSGLGSALADGTGYNDSFQEAAFAAGLKGIALEAADSVHDLVLTSLAEIARGGLDRGQVEAALHQFELSRRERSNVPTSQALRTLFALLPACLYGADPVPALDTDAALAGLQEDLADGGGERLIGELLADGHQARLVLAPDPDLLGERERAEEARLIAIRDRLDGEGASALVATAAALRRRQESFDDASVLPLLTPADISISFSDAPLTGPSLDRGRVSFFSQPTGGFSYAEVQIDCAEVGAGPFEYAGLLAYVLPRVGIPGVTSEAMARRIAAATGGVDAGVRGVSTLDGGALLQFAASGKALARNRSELMQILGDLLEQADFVPGRLHQLVQERVGQLRSRLPSMVRELATLRSRVPFRPGAARLDAGAGIASFRLLTRLAQLPPDGLEESAAMLESLRGALAGATGIEICLTAEAGERTDSVETATALLRRLAVGGGSMAAAPEERPPPDAQAFTTPASVSTNVLTLPTVPYTHPDAAVLPVLARYLSTTYLHREVREKGGAYGATAAADARAGLFSFVSFADPHIVRTHEVWRSAAAAIAGAPIDELELGKAIVGASSTLDPLESPDSRGRRTLLDLRSGFTAEVRAEFAGRLRAVTAGDLARCADTYLRFENGALVTIGGPDAVAAANADGRFRSVEPLAGPDTL